MADVLSQAQIDALLNAVRTGEKDLNSSDADNQKKYQKYDFASPRKFTKDRIKMLNGIFENYGRVVSSRLNARLRTNCEVTVESIEEQRYYEFSNALTEGDVLALIGVDLKGKEKDAPVLFYLSTNTALSMMDRLMGGEGAPDDHLDSEYSYTDLELQLYEDLIRDIASVMDSSWENYIAVHYYYDKTDVNPTLNQILGVDETVIIADMKLQFSNMSGRMSICMPGELLMDIFAEISRENPVRRTAVEDKSEEIFDSLRDSRLEIIAELGGTELSLRDVYHLNVGDVIDLGHSKDSPIYLEIGGYRWFSGRMGTHKKNMAVKIDDVCYQAEQRSE
ncbi:MAG: flagellar motor switch protein FliM [Oscillibacter sp.]|nr:flagellar motor switch protein FliM [Oscillibacter sp.]